MAIIFNPQNAGSVIAINVGPALPGAVRIGGLNSQHMIITSMGIHQEANFQVAQALQNTLYMYTFGDKIGQMSIGAVAFHKSCSSASQTALLPPGSDPTDPSDFNSNNSNNSSGFAGLQDLGDFYRDFSVRNKVEPVIVSLGTSTIRSFLVGFAVNSGDPEMNLMEVTMQFLIPPALDAKKKKR